MEEEQEHYAWSTYWEPIVFIVSAEPKHPCRRHINRTNYVHTATSSVRRASHTIYNKFFFAFRTLSPSHCIVFLAVRRHTQFVSCIICLYYWICRNCWLTETFVSRLLCLHRLRVFLLLVFLFLRLTSRSRMNAKRAEVADDKCYVWRNENIWALVSHRLQIGMLCAKYVYDCWALIYALTLCCSTALKRNYLFTCNDACSFNDLGFLFHFVFILRAILLLGGN